MGTTRIVSRATALLVVALSLVLSSLTIAASTASAAPPDAEPEQRDRCGTKYDAYFLPSLANENEYYRWVVNGKSEYDTSQEHSTKGATQVLVELIDGSSGESVRSWTLKYTDKPCGPDVANTYKTGVGACDTLYDKVEAWVDITNNNAAPSGNLNVQPVRIEDGNPAGNLPAGSIKGGQTTRVMLETSNPGLPLGHYVLRVTNDRDTLIDRVQMTVDDPSGACGEMPPGELRGTLTNKGEKVVASVDAHRWFERVKPVLIVKKAGHQRTIPFRAKPQRISKRSFKLPRGAQVVLKGNRHLLDSLRT